ncbi:MAG: GNAT family N-acetyltransferase [Desulfovibrionaceae bacterium]|nr:GNAT family N-acetyltransferase [Desulfovibrionaceae bacterium]
MIAVRPARPGEEFVIEDVIRRSILASYAHFLPKKVFRRIMDADRPGVEARENGPDFAIAELDGTPAGAMLLTGDYVDHLWTHPDFMGRGVGSALLAHAEARAAQAGHPRLTLNCFERNKQALAFYHARGYATERTYTASEDIVAGERVCFMAKQIDPDPAASR